MIAPDSSVLVAGSETAHVHHEPAAATLAEVARRGSLIAHTLAETYSTLTGPAFAEAPRTVQAYLEQFDERPIVWLSADRYRAALKELAESGFAGASIHDGLIAISARESSLTLASLDRRARTTYKRLGVEFELIA